MTASVAVEEMTTRVHCPLRCSHWERAAACGTQSRSALVPAADLLTSHRPPDADSTGGSVAAASVSIASPMPAGIKYFAKQTRMCPHKTATDEQNLGVQATSSSAIGKSVAQKAQSTRMKPSSPTIA